MSQPSRNIYLVPSYLTLVLIWSTTALGIKWGVTGLPFTFALMARFTLAALLALMLLAWRRQSLPKHSSALTAYAIAGVATSLSMLCTFWASQFINSGLVAVLFGLVPLATALFSRWILHSPLQKFDYIACGLGLAGLLTLFQQRITLAPDGFIGIAALLIAVFLQSGAAVMLKRYAIGQSPLAVNVGALLICALLSTLFWLIAGAPVAETIPLRAAAAIIYLASIGSVFAFSLYYWLIRECRPISVALISLITPATSLWLGHTFNSEIIQRQEIIGTALILLGLVIYGFGMGRRGI